MSENQQSTIDRKTVIIVVMIMVVAALAFWSVQQSGDDMDKTQEMNSKQSTADTTSDLSIPELKSEDYDECGEGESIELGAVNGFSGNGNAVRSYCNGEYHLVTTSNIGEPPEGKFFEGWLIGLRVISTGAFEKQDDGSYVNEFTANSNYIELGYDRVVITEENKADGLDEEHGGHVLEGSF